MILNSFSFIAESALEFLCWYDECESLGKLVLIPVSVIAYAVMIICDAIDMIIDRFED